MTGIDKLMCRAAALVLLAALSASPAKAQFGGDGGGEDMMTRMAPMLEMMKAKMGKRRFTMLMQTMGPMMSDMMDNDGGLGGTAGFGAPGGLGGMTSGGFGGGAIGGFDGGQMVGMIPQLMTMVNTGGGHRHRRSRRHAR